MTLDQARAALAAAETLNTADAWKAAALAFAAAQRKPKAPRSDDPLDVVNREKRTILHSVRCTLDNGYSVRVTIGQGKGESARDCLSRMTRFTLDCYRAENLCVRPVRTQSGTVDYLPCRPWDNGARLLHGAASVVDCRIVRWGCGADAGVDLEEIVDAVAA